MKVEAPEEEEAPAEVHPIYGAWTCVAVNEVDEEAEASAAAQLKAVLHAHATGKRLMTGEKDDGAWSGAEARALGKAAAGEAEEGGLGDDPDPVDAFSTHNPYGGAYKVCMLMLTYGRRGGIFVPGSRGGVIVGQVAFAIGVSAPNVVGNR